MDNDGELNLKIRIWWRKNHPHVSDKITDRERILEFLRLLVAVGHRVGSPASECVLPVL